MTHNITTLSKLRYLTIHLKYSKTDPLRKGIDVFIGCSGTPLCGACATWDLIQSHQANWGSPTAPFFQLYGWPLTRAIMVGHMKGLLARLGFNPSFYSGHSLHTGEATTATMAGLRDWEIKSLGQWKSNTYQTYTRETIDMKVNCVSENGPCSKINHLQLQLPLPSEGQV